ncbi:hypothetical protein DFP72DRAFT_1076698 [Ephemerocybe angulata]|nr:hypothetical protein DFP72DRAFT_1077701 [Tulosesus angulatus]KAF6746116.1 hypothetical protein DFP72DRAFT_1076698 [Tulosesus angulatus]
MWDSVNLTSGSEDDMAMEDSDNESLSVNESLPVPVNIYPSPPKSTETSMAEVNSRLKMVADSGAFDIVSDDGSDTLPTCTSKNNTESTKAQAHVDGWNDDAELDFTVPQLGKVRPSKETLHSSLGLPPTVPQSWIDAFHPDSASAMVTTEILNLHIRHLRWTYRCLLAHYAHCDKVRTMLHTQAACLSRAIATKMSAENLASSLPSSSAGPM